MGFLVLLMIGTVVQKLQSAGVMADPNDDGLAGARLSYVENANANLARQEGQVGRAAVSGQYNQVFQWRHPGCDRKLAIAELVNEMGPRLKREGFWRVECADLSGYVYASERL